MVSILLPLELVDRVARALRKAGRREVGGMLMGEHLGEGRFRVVDLSIQMSGGDAVCFLRDPREHEAFTQSFFEQTGSDYARFNYLGEWHSHPNHMPLPSSIDLRAMQEIVETDDNSPLFAVLLIFRLERHEVALSGTAYRRDRPSESVDLIIEGDVGGQSIFSRLKRTTARLLGVKAAKQSNSSLRNP